MWRRVETALRSARRAPRSPDLAIVAIGANLQDLPVQGSLVTLHLQVDR